jgi:hypothetical protein
MISPVDAQPNFVQRLNGLPLRSKLTMGVGLAALAGAVLAITLWSAQGDYRPLFTGLADKDGGAVIDRLADRWGCALRRSWRLHARVGSCHGAGQGVLLAKPPLPDNPNLK